MFSKLRQASVFKDFSDNDFNYLQSISNVKNIKKDCIVFYKGDEPKNLFVLLDGSVKIYKNNQKGNEIILRVINPVSFIAQLANIEHMPYPSSCATITNSSILSIDFKKFEDRFLTDPKLSLLFIKSLTKMTMKLEETVSTNLTLDSTSKVAKHIYESSPLDCPLNHKVSASMLNITPETYSRVVRKFKDKNIIDEIDGKFIILDSEKLQKYFDI
jgi:CRP/FNR family transcriptional regulator